jgi:hypothetical protein
VVAGLGGAACIWRAQDRIDRANQAAQAANPAALLSTLDSRRQERDIEIYYGKFGVLMEEAKELFHGKPLARMIGVGSIVTAAGLLFVRSRLRR